MKANAMRNSYEFCLELILFIGLYLSYFVPFYLQSPHPRLPSSLRWCLVKTRGCSDGPRLQLMWLMTTPSWWKLQHCLVLPMLQPSRVRCLGRAENSPLTVLKNPAPFPSRNNGGEGAATVLTQTLPAGEYYVNREPGTEDWGPGTNQGLGGQGIKDWGDGGSRTGGTGDQGLGGQGIKDWGDRGSRTAWGDRISWTGDQGLGGQEKKDWGDRGSKTGGTGDQGLGGPGIKDWGTGDQGLGGPGIKDWGDRGSTTAWAFRFLARADL